MFSLVRTKGRKTKPDDTAMNEGSQRATLHVYAIADRRALAPAGGRHKFRHSALNQTWDAVNNSMPATVAPRILHLECEKCLYDETRNASCPPTLIRVPLCPTNKHAYRNAELTSTDGYSRSLRHCRQADDTQSFGNASRNEPLLRGTSRRSRKIQCGRTDEGPFGVSGTCVLVRWLMTRQPIAYMCCGSVTK